MRINSVADFRRAINMGPYAWPGGYEIVMVTSDGRLLCSSCVRKEMRNIIFSIVDKVDDGWRVVGAETLECYETYTQCDHCNIVLINEEEEDDA
jgi:hypothetical protein